MSIFQSLEVVDRVNETQLHVGTNFRLNNQANKELVVQFLKY